MTANYAKAKLSFGTILLNVIFSGILIVCTLLMVFLFIKPSDYPETVHNFSTIEEVKNVNSYQYVKDAIEYLIKRESVDEIDSISYVFDEHVHGYVYVDLCVKYTNQNGKHTKYLSVDKYKTREYSYARYEYYTEHHYDIEFSSKDEYENVKNSWIDKSTKEAAYASIERTFNEFSVDVIWKDVKDNNQGGF